MVSSRILRIRSFRSFLASVKTTRGKYRNFADDSEVAKFNKLSKEWWDPDGPLLPLHQMNSLRVPFIKDTLLQQGLHKIVAKAKPLHGYKILDVGCGGGFLTEPLARLGASVTGIDPAEESIKVAGNHALQDAKIKDYISYKCTTVEELAKGSSEAYNAVVASEVMEHVTERQSMVKSVKAVLKPGGYFFITTINRTALSLLTVKIAAEYFLNLVPRGAHDWELFITTEELFYLLHHNGFEEVNFRGMTYNPFIKKWSWTNSISANYACVCRKPEH